MGLFPPEALRYQPEAPGNISRLRNCGSRLLFRSYEKVVQEAILSGDPGRTQVPNAPLGCTDSRRSGARSASLVVILDTDDVVFAEIAAGLHFDQFEQNLAGVFQPVGGADRDVDRLVLVDDLDEIIDRYPRRTANHDPVLGTVVMHLQRQPPAGLHHDALDLMAVAIVERLIRPPR